MTREQRKRLKLAATIISLIWMAVAGAKVFPGLEIENHGSSTLKDRMATECAGTFRDRYECKEALIVQSGQDTFWTVTGAAGIVVLPPTLLGLFLSSYLRRHPVDPMHAHQQHHADDWKSRAQTHTHVQNPQEAAQALHLSPQELEAKYGHRNPHPIQNIAPMDDWKTRAQQHMRQGHKDQD